MSHPPIPPRTRPARANAGFTLIEVVIAVAVVAIAVTAAFQIVAQAALGTSYMQEKTLATWIALNRIAELRLQPGLPEVGESDGDLDYGPTEWVWEAEVIATQVEGLRRIEVEVRYDRNDEQPLAKVVGFVGNRRGDASVASAWPLNPAGPGGPGQGATGEEILDDLRNSP